MALTCHRKPYLLFCIKCILWFFFPLISSSHYMFSMKIFLFIWFVRHMGVLRSFINLCATCKEPREAHDLVLLMFRRHIAFAGSRNVKCRAKHRFACILELVCHCRAEVLWGKLGKSTLYNLSLFWFEGFRSVSQYAMSELVLLSLPARWISLFSGIWHIDMCVWS